MRPQRPRLRRSGRRSADASSGGWDTPEGRELVAFFTRVNRRTELPVILTGRGAMVARARSVLADLYPIIAEVSGSSLDRRLVQTPVVGLSAGRHRGHRPPGGAPRASPVGRRPLVEQPGPTPPRPEPGRGTRSWPRHSPVEVCIRWDVFNLLYRRPGPAGGRPPRSSGTRTTSPTSTATLRALHGAVRASLPAGVGSGRRARDRRKSVEVRRRGCPGGAGRPVAPPDGSDPAPAGVRRSPGRRGRPTATGPRAPRRSGRSRCPHAGRSRRTPPSG